MPPPDARFIVANDPAAALASVQRDRLLADAVERACDLHAEWCVSCAGADWPKDGCTWTGDRDLLRRFAALEAK